MSSWPDATRVLVLATAVAGVVVGVAAESERYAWSETHGWVPDLLVGWTLAGLGLAAAIVGRPRGAALLLLLAGLMWFTGNFFAAEQEWIASLATRFSWVFLAPLIHLSLAYPTGRPRGGVATVGVTAAWLAVVVPGLDWNDERTRIAALSAFVTLGCVLWLRSVARARRDGAWGLVALAVLLASMIVASRLEPVGSWDLSALALGAGVVLAGGWLFAGLSSGAMLAERLLELDETAGSVQGALATILDDPTLRVGYASAAGPFVDDEGGPVLASPGSVTTEIEAASGTVAIVVHDRSVLTRDDERQWVSVPVALAAERARLQEQVRLRADEVAQSARRLVRADDDARARVHARFASGPAAALDVGTRILGEARRLPSSDAELDAAIVRTVDQLTRAQGELATFAEGLGPAAALDAGLASAVASMVDGLPLRVDIRVDDVEYPPDVAATVWFVCAEGVANVLKHAGASRLLLEVVATPGGVRVTVRDDGRGGADVNGSGISGLRDRVAALGGRLRVSSSDGGGTTLVAELGVRG
jgi:signal transduction histidine kinase